MHPQTQSKLSKSPPNGGDIATDTYDGPEKDSPLVERKSCLGGCLGWLVLIIVIILVAKLVF